MQGILSKGHRNFWWSTVALQVCSPGGFILSFVLLGPGFYIRRLHFLSTVFMTPSGLGKNPFLGTTHLYQPNVATPNPITGQETWYMTIGLMKQMSCGAGCITAHKMGCNKRRGYEEWVAAIKGGQGEFCYNYFEENILKISLYIFTCRCMKIRWGLFQICGVLQWTISKYLMREVIWYPS